MIIGEPTDQSSITTTTLQHNQIGTIIDLLTAPHSIIVNLSSLKIDSKGRSTTKKLWPAQSNKLKVLHAFSIFTNKPNDPLTLLKWMTINPQNFDSFQLHDYRPYDDGSLAPTLNTTSNKSNQFNSTYTPQIEAAIFNAPLNVIQKISKSSWITSNG